MALSRRTGARFQASIWPGFVDAMTGLLLVLMFLLTIFMVVQFVLRETISGQETELNELAGEVAALAQALGLEEQRANQLDARSNALNTTLNAARDQVAQQSKMIDTLTSQRDTQAQQLADANTKITSFEAQVAGLLAQRDVALGTISELEADQTRLVSEQEALNLALAQSRSEIDAQSEAARLAASKREALEALIADLQVQGTEAANRVVALEGELSESQRALTEAETTRLVEAAAAEALRKRLENADTELTAMTLALEAQRREAEDTLTLLAAARASEDALNGKLAQAVAAKLATEQALTEADLTAEDVRAELAAALAAKLQSERKSDEVLSESEQRAIMLENASVALSEEREISLAAQRQTELLNQQVAALRTQLDDLSGLLALAEDRDAEAQVQLQSLGSDLNTALARAVAEERRRRVLEEAERVRLEAATKDLEQYRSEFFGRLRDLLGNQEGVRIEGDRFVFSSEVLFPPGGATLSRSGEGEIAKIAGILRGIADEIPPEIDWVIRVDGHTDNIPLSGFGEFADNWELSQARALSVVKYMTNFLGIAPDRLAANGFGQYQPINTDDTPEARAQNRRIELKFTEK